MNIAEKFRSDLEENFSKLQEDEWAFTRYREDIINGLDPNEAYQNILPLIQLGASLSEQDSLVECCWLSMAVIAKSETTEISDALRSSLKSLISNAEIHNCVSEVVPIIKWYRLANEHT